MRRKILYLISIPIIACLVGAGLIPAFAKVPAEWTQVNESGFGGVSNDGVIALEVFKGDLYAGTSYWSDPYELGASVWRWDSGSQWTRVSEYGFGSETPNSAITDLATFNGMLYAGTTDWAGMGSTGQIWRTADGMTWRPVETAGFGNPDTYSVTRFTVYEDVFYAAAANANGWEIWRSSTGDPESWERVVEAGFGDGTTHQVTDFVEFKDALYVAIENRFFAATPQVWRTVDGTDWTPVTLDGFGDPNNLSSGGFAIFQGYLYLGTLNFDGVNLTSYGGQVWRSKDGLNWTQVIGDGFGDPGNFKVESLYTFRGQLYAITWGIDLSTFEDTGVVVWRSADGVHWTQASDEGFGDPCNWSTMCANATQVFKGSLFVGTWNYCDGGEVWQLSR